MWKNIYPELLRLDPGLPLNPNKPGGVLSVIGKSKFTLGRDKSVSNSFWEIETFWFSKTLFITSLFVGLQLLICSNAKELGRYLTLFPLGLVKLDSNLNNLFNGSE